MFTKGDTSPFKERENQTFMLGAMQQQLERMNKRLIDYSELKFLYESSLLLLVSHGNFFSRTYQRSTVFVVFIIIPKVLGSI